MWLTDISCHRLLSFASIFQTVSTGSLPDGKGRLSICPVEHAHAQPSINMKCWVCFHFFIFGLKMKKAKTPTKTVLLWTRVSLSSRSGTDGQLYSCTALSCSHSSNKLDCGVCDSVKIQASARSVKTRLVAGSSHTVAASYVITYILFYFILLNHGHVRSVLQHNCWLI